MGHATALHQSEGVLDQPAGIAKLNHVLIFLWQRVQEILETLQVQPPVRRKLIQNRTQGTAKFACIFEKTRNRLLRIL
jgi:hypothetical protein